MKSIYLERVVSGNPFETYPELREIFYPARSRYVEEETVGVLQNYSEDKGNIYLVRDICSRVIGITGFYFYDETTVGLRWRGLIPSARGKCYSEAMFAQVRWMLSLEHPQIKRILELIPLKNLKQAQRLSRHFKRLGFKMEGEPLGAKWYPSHTSLPLDSGLWTRWIYDL